MNASLVPARAEFYFRKPDNMILVENGDDGVIIRAAHDNFSEKRKSLFIRELASEGFIPGHLQWSTDSDFASPLGVKWVVDSSWVRVHSKQQRRVRARLARIYFFASLSWLSLMAIVLKLAGAHFRF
jgi:hypothetical protein